MEVALQTHRTEDEEAEAQRAGRGEPVAERAPAARRAGRRPLPRPVERRGRPRGFTGGEADALIEGIGPEMHHAPALMVEVDLHGVTPGVAVQPRAIALVDHGVVESGLGEREIGRRGVGLDHDRDTDVELLWSLGNFGRTTAQVAAALQHEGLRAPSAHVSPAVILVGWERSVETAKLLGHQYLIVPGFTADTTRTIDDWLEWADRFI